MRELTRTLLVVVTACLLTGCTGGIAPLPTPTAVVQPAQQLPTDFPAVGGYDRSCSPGRACSFGPAWSDDTNAEYGHNGCDTRNDILRRDLQQVVVDGNTRGCVVLSGTLADPYSGTVIYFQKGSASVQIDHIFPLAAAWNRGAWRWTTEQRRDFANDPDNLQATTVAMNASKGDRLPGDWMPPADRCGYALRVATVADKWHLPLTARDVDALQDCNK